HGNSSTCAFTVTINDIEFPTLTCPADKNVEVGSAWTFDQPTAADNCGTPTLTFTTTTNVTCGNSFIAIRTWTAVDASGNTTTCSQTVNVGDTTAPTVTITSPTNGTVFLARAQFPVSADATDVRGSVANVE